MKKRENWKYRDFYQPLHLYCKATTIYCQLMPAEVLALKVFIFWTADSMLQSTAVFSTASLISFKPLFIASRTEHLKEEKTNIPTSFKSSITVKNIHFNSSSTKPHLLKVFLQRKTNSAYMCKYNLVNFLIQIFPHNPRRQNILLCYSCSYLVLRHSAW